MRGPDVALGSTDTLHCYAAMAYVADHLLANQGVLGAARTASIWYLEGSLEGSLS